MALKGFRIIGGGADTDVSFFMNETCNRGGVAVFSTVGSGEALDQSQALVTMTIPTSGAKPAGLVLDDMVNYDLTRQHINFNRHEVQKGRKISLLRRGVVLTDQVSSGITIAAGDVAYLAAGNATDRGRVTNTVHSTGGVAVTPVVGQWLSKPDEDGYAKLSINLP